MRVPHQLLQTLGPAPGAALLRLGALTLRIRREEEAVAPLWRAGTPIIYAVWHGRIFLLPYLYGGRRCKMLTSHSRDGELVARWASRFGLEPVRGSSSRGGALALRRLLRALRAGHEVVVVPDGPRGPREIVKPGLVALARLSGAPVVPTALGAWPEWRLGSWDEFRIPKPFARCVMRFGKPIHVPGATDQAGEEAARKEIETALRTLAWRVDAEARG